MIQEGTVRLGASALLGLFAMFFAAPAVLATECDPNDQLKCQSGQVYDWTGCQCVWPEAATDDPERIPRCENPVPVELRLAIGRALYRRLWQDIEPRLESYFRDIGHEAYRWSEGWGDVRTDAFWVRIPRLDRGLASMILGAMIQNYNGLLPRHSAFNTMVEWPSAAPDGRRVGDWVRLRFSPDSGAVGYTDINPRAGYFAVMTLYDARIMSPAVGTHPVSGSREWGYVLLPDASGYFYTVAVESSSVAAGGWLGAKEQRKVWTTLMSELQDVADARGGGRDFGPVGVTEAWLESYWRDKVDLYANTEKTRDAAIHQILGLLKICDR